MIEAVVFDLDGTLVRLPIDYERCLRSLSESCMLTRCGPSWTPFRRRMRPTRALVFRAWDKAELAVSGKITVNEEGMKIYREFEDTPKALVTLQGKEVVDAIKDHFGLNF